MKIRCSFLMTMIIILSSCASIPKESAELSILLGRQIDALEQGHVATIRAYYKEKELAAIHHLDEVWYRRYLDDLFAQPGTIEFWNEVIKEEPAQRIESLKELTDLVQTDYREQREQLLNPLKEQENELLATIQNHYDLARKMNQAITEHVRSAHEVQEKRKQLIAHFADTDKIEKMTDQYLQKADSLLHKVQTTLGQVENKLK